MQMATLIFLLSCPPGHGSLLKQDHCTGKIQKEIMPGLFGILELASRRNSREDQRALFAKMANSLRHHEDDQMERAYITNSGLMVGRVGLPGQNLIGWGKYFDKEESGNPFFIAGPFWERETHQTVDRLPDHADLLHWHGLFSAVVTDHRREATILVVDRRASFPIFYTQINDQLFFAPEIKALLVNPLVKREIDHEAMATFLAQGYLLADQTLFRSVRRLEGGQFLRVENGRVTKETYWRFSPGSAAGTASEADLECELGDLLNAAARKHMGDPGKSVIFLSGGVDSRGVPGRCFIQCAG